MAGAGVLALIVLVLAAAVLAKYVFAR